MALRENIEIAWTIFWRDIRRLKRHPFAVLIVCGLCLMPSFYAWYTILANWNPYARASALKVAVANDDAGAENSLVGKVNVGNDVVRVLQKNHELGWTFVSKDEALQGVESGAFFAAYIFPESFSEDFLSILTGDFKTPQLDYYVNEKISAVAPEFTNTAATTIESKIDETFVNAVGTVVVELTQNVGDQIQIDTNYTEDSLLEGVTNAKTVIDSVQTSTSGLETDIQKAKDTLAHSQTALDENDQHLEDLEGSLESSMSELKALRKTINSYGSTVTNALSEASQSLGKAAAGAQTASAKASAAATKAEGVVSATLQSAQRALAQNEALLKELQTLAANKAELTSAIKMLEQENQQLEATISALQKLQDTLDASNADMEAAQKSLDSVANDAANQLARASKTLQETTIPALTTSIDAFVEALGLSKGAVVAMGPFLQNGKSTLNLLAAALDQATAALTTTDTTLKDIQTELNNSLTDIETLSSSASMEQLSRYLGLDPKDVGQFIASPIELKTIREFPVANYGSGVTPFYTNLALWVSGFVLTSVLKIRVDLKDLPAISVTQAYLGRWLLFVVLALIQGLIVCIGDLILGIQCVNPVAFVAAGLWTVFVDVNILFALVFALRHLGRALGVVLLVVQIPGSAGEYPVEMLPSFFEAIHPYLPFTYSINAMREAIGGFYDGVYWTSLAGLLPFLAIALLIGLVGGRYAFNLNALFDEELSATDLMISEVPNKMRQHFRLRALLRTLYDADAFRNWVNARVKRFHRIYPLLLRIGWAAICALPALTLALAFFSSANENVKAFLLTCMVSGLVMVTIYLIVVEFIEWSLKNDQELASLDPATIRERMVAGQKPVEDASERDLETNEALEDTSTLFVGGKLGKGEPPDTIATPSETQERGEDDV